MPQFIEIDVHCAACGERIPRPADADMELFRAGVPVHSRSECLAKLQAKLEEREMRREARRSRDLDDGIIWSDDH